MLKKILFISQYLNRNGTEAFMMNVFRGIDHSRFRVDFLIFTEDITDYTKEVEAAGCTVHRLPNRKSSGLAYYRNVERFFRNNASEYVAVHYCGNSLSSMAPLFYAYRYGIPVRIVHAHNSSAKGLHNKILHLLKRNYVKSISTHHLACSSLAVKWFFGKSDAVVIKNGIDTKHFAFNSKTRSEMRASMGISDTTTVIGNVGRVVKEKNHTFMLDIFAEYVKKNSDSILMLVGIGSLMEEMKNKVDSLGLKDKVRFLGERSDVNRLMQAMDAFLMPSLFEGFPFVLVEAQCSGLPCTISNTINRDVKLTDNVFFLPLEAPVAEWSEAIDNSLKNNDRSKQADIVSSAGYSIGDTITYLEKVYNGEL